MAFESRELKLQMLSPVVWQHCPAPLETLAGLQSDLIVGTPWGAEELYDQLSAIAPMAGPYYADWAEVHIEFAAPDGSETGTYVARVEVCGTVMIQWNSGPD